MDKIFAVGDVHGEETRFQHMLTKWNPDSQRLVLLGDFIDRGENSYGVLHLAKQLHDQYGAVILSGNHEQLFLNWIDAPVEENDVYLPQGGRETLRSFFGRDVAYTHTPTHIANLIRTQFEDDIHFLKDLPLYHEWNDYVFVHAGVNLNLSNWKNSTENDFCWRREPFYSTKNETGKTFVFGHTLTSLLNEDESQDIWISPCRTKIGLDGGAVFGGLLHATVIDNEGQSFISLDKHLHFQEKSIKLSA